MIPGRIKARTVWKSNTGGGVHSETAYKHIYFYLFYFIDIEILVVKWNFYRPDYVRRTNKPTFSEWLSSRELSE